MGFFNIMLPTVFISLIFMGVCVVLVGQENDAKIIGLIVATLFASTVIMFVQDLVELRQDKNHKS